MKTETTETTETTEPAKPADPPTPPPAGLNYWPLRDDSFFDEVRLFTRPRYKTSGLSGDEWRVSGEIELKHKGEVVFTDHFHDVATAAIFLAGILITARENLPPEMRAEVEARFGCMQPGCAEQATAIFQLKQRFCQWGHVEDMHAPTYRRFCQRHTTRGDSSLEDCDDNYELVWGWGRADVAPQDRSPAGVVHLVVNDLAELPGQLKQTLEDVRSGKITPEPGSAPHSS